MSKKEYCNDDVHQKNDHGLLYFGQQEYGRKVMLHIVGEMTYKCLGNDRYEIRFTLRRDCFNGSPEAGI